jgi:hypothetical protein
MTTSPTALIFVDNRFRNTELDNQINIRDVKALFNRE